MYINIIKKIHYFIYKENGNVLIKYLLNTFIIQFIYGNTLPYLIDAHPICWINKWGVFMSHRRKYSYELCGEILRYTLKNKEIHHHYLMNI